MHFTIPDTTEISAKQSSTQQAYTLFNIHLNGIHQCSLRYSQLRTFHEDLERLFSNAMNELKPFPPKKLFSLSAKEAEERRSGLELYLQSISQNKYLVSSSYFNDFFFRAQIETFAQQLADVNDKVNITIYLLNNHEIIIENFTIRENTGRLLDTIFAKVQVKDDFLSYFSLYLYDHKENDVWTILRPLYDFESPYLSLLQTKKMFSDVCIVLKKSYWNTDYDLALLDDRRTRNLLFVQAQYEMEQSRILDPNETDEQLETLHNNNSLKEYIGLARTTKFYGHIFLHQCSMLYPIEETSKQTLEPCVLAIGNYQIICCFNNEETSSKKQKKRLTSREIIFKVTRIRCWKTNWTERDASLSIEYLIKKDNLLWINIHTKQAALISACLQSMVEEILAKKAGATSPVNNSNNTTTVNNISNATVPTSKKNDQGLKRRTESDLERLNNNTLFDQDDDLDL